MRAPPHALLLAYLASAAGAYIAQLRPMPLASRTATTVRMGQLETLRAELEVLRQKISSTESAIDAAYGPASPAAARTGHLEVEPYHDQSQLPLNTYKNKAPHTAAIISAKRIVGPKATGEVCHIHINSGPTFKYWEGQSLGVIPPGTNPKNGKPNTVRLYSIASTR